MSSPRDELALRRSDKEVRESAIEALAETVIALVDEFEGMVSQGYVPVAFATRLAQLRRTADLLFDES